MLIIYVLLREGLMICTVVCCSKGSDKVMYEGQYYRSCMYALVYLNRFLNTLYSQCTPVSVPQSAPVL